MTEGVQLQQPLPPSGPFPWWRKAAIALLGISVAIGIFLALRQQEAPNASGRRNKNEPAGIAILPGNIRVPACATQYEGRIVKTPNGRYVCTFTPDGGHMWKMLPPTPGEMAPDTSSSPGSGANLPGTLNQPRQPGQTPEQARRDAIREQRTQKLIAAAFSDSRVTQEQRQPQQGGTQNVLTPGQSPVQTGTQPLISQPPITTPTVPSPAPLDFDRRQPLYWLPEGSLFDAVLENKLDGSSNGPFQAIVTTNKYYPGTHILLVPQGAQLLGEVGRVSSFGQDRLAVTFHRLLVYPPLETGSTQPYSIPLERQPPGQSQDGATGLTGKVNTHWLSTFGSAAAVGGITGLSELGSFNGSYSPTAGFYMGLSNSASQATDVVLQKYLNRLPTVTVPPGTRIKVALVADQQFPAVPDPQMASR